MKTTFVAFAAAGALSAMLAPAAQAQVTVTDPWIRATVPQAKATGAFMQLRSAQDARLVEVRSSVAGVAEVHQMALENNVMRMSAMPALDLPAGKLVPLASGGYHIMLMQLKQQVKEGDVVPLTLVIETRDKKRELVELKVPVKALTYSPTK